MRYNIRISYRTGDSNSSYDRVDNLDGTWKNKDIIKENLQHILEHYNWYKYEHGWFKDKNKPVEEPAWHIGKPEYSVVLKTDDGVEYLCSAFWCGYFETLYGAKAVPVKEEEEMGFTI